MMVYVAFWNDGVDEVMAKVFSDLEKAKQYTASKRETTEIDWYVIPMKVEQ